LVKVTHLTKTYGDRVVVNDLSFELEKGKVYGFLGPNGAGKSTTMNMITGYLAPTKGSVLINDVSMQKDPCKAKAQIGYLPEIPPLYMDMTVYEYLEFAAELKSVPGFQKTEEIEKVICKAHLKEVSDRLIKNLSKGYRQRTGLAQALLGNPEILIFDEPSVGLDPKQIVEIRNLIKELGKEHTVILSTHILSEVCAVCDHVLIISKGQLMANATPDDLMQEYNEKQRLMLVLKGNATGAHKAVEKIKGVECIHVIEEGASSCKIEITAKPGCDLRENVSEVSQKQGCTILELNVSHVTLEEVYLKLTTEEHYKEILAQKGLLEEEEEIEMEEE